jgi:hypothetical protein
VRRKAGFVLVLGALACVTLLAPGCRGRPSAAGPPVGGPARPADQANAVPELPGFPGAHLVSFEARADPRHGFRTVYRALFTCASPFEEVESFYEKVVVDGGWQVLRTSLQRWSADGPRSGVQLTLSKGLSLAVVQIGRENEVITLAIERSDR